jgi:hypothetical protein
LAVPFSYKHLENISLFWPEKFIYALLNQKYVRKKFAGPSGIFQREFLLCKANGNKCLKKIQFFIKVPGQGNCSSVTTLQKNRTIGVPGIFLSLLKGNNTFMTVSAKNDIVPKNYQFPFRSFIRLSGNTPTPGSLIAEPRGRDQFPAIPGVVRNASRPARAKKRPDSICEEFSCNAISGTSAEPFVFSKS